MNLNNLSEQKKALIQLGKVLNLLIDNDKWPGYVCGIGEEEFSVFKLALKRLQSLTLV